MKMGDRVFKKVPGTDFIWMSNYLGESDYFVHSSVIEGTVYYFAKGRGDNIIFSLVAYPILEREKVRGSDQYLVLVEVSSDNDYTFNGGRDSRNSPSAWFFDNEWPVYLDGDGTMPMYDWMYGLGDRADG